MVSFPVIFPYIQIYIQVSRGMMAVAKRQPITQLPAEEVSKIATTSVTTYNITKSTIAIHAAICFPFRLTSFLPFCIQNLFLFL